MVDQSSEDKQVVDFANALADRGKIVEAAQMLGAALDKGDAQAAFTLAQWRVSGAYIRRDLKLARDMFLRAAELGSDQADVVSIAMLANGAGGSERQWQAALGRLQRRSTNDRIAAQQLTLIKGMAIDGHGDPLTGFAPDEIRSDPKVFALPRFLNLAECAYLVSQAEPLLRPSVVVHPVTQQYIQDPIRTSTAAGFPFVAEDPVMHAINRRIAAATSTAYEQGEPLQILSYSPGQQYKLHMDALPPGPNQRILTLLVYLNDAYAGGETSFPDLGLTHRGAAGDALLFSNVDGLGNPHSRSRHAGRPVLSGRKLILSKWIRAKPLDLTGPPGRPL